MATRNGRRTLFGLLGAAVLIAAASAREPQRLQNDEFGFSVGAPPGTVSCVVASPAGDHRHGFNLLLHPDARGCRSVRPQPYVMILGDYNVVPYATSADWLRSIYKCPRQQPSSDNKGPVGLAFPGHASASCEAQGKGGWVDVFVAAGQGSQPGGTGAPAGVPYIYHTAVLHTTRDRLEDDVKTFRKILAGVSIFPPR